MRKELKKKEHVSILIANFINDIHLENKVKQIKLIFLFFFWNAFKRLYKRFNLI